MIDASQQKIESFHCVQVSIILQTKAVLVDCTEKVIYNKLISGKKKKIQVCWRKKEVGEIQSKSYSLSFGPEIWKNV